MTSVLGSCVIRTCEVSRLSILVLLFTALSTALCGKNRLTWKYFRCPPPPHTQRPVFYKKKNKYNNTAIIFKQYNHQGVSQSIQLLQFPFQPTDVSHHDAWLVCCTAWPGRSCPKRKAQSETVNTLDGGWRGWHQTQTISRPTYTRPYLMFIPPSIPCVRHHLGQDGPGQRASMTRGALRIFSRGASRNVHL